MAQQADTGSWYRESHFRFSTALAASVARLATRFTAKGAARRYRVVIGGHPRPHPSPPGKGAAS